MIYIVNLIEIPKEILRNYLDRCMRLPTTANVRSLNLSNCVAIASYEVLRQQDYPDLFKSLNAKETNFIFIL